MKRNKEDAKKMPEKTSSRAVFRKKTAKKQNDAEAKKQSKTKKISLPQPLKKIVGAVVHPIKTIAGRKQKTDEVDVPFAESTSATELTTSMKFFYSNDRFIDTFDDEDIYEKICMKWPALHQSQKSLQ